jgi:predicted Zn-dependent peptidase
VTSRRAGSPAGWALPVQHPGTTHTLLSPQDAGIDQALGTVRRTVLPGGVRVITEKLATVRSVSVGVWAGVGSRDETPALAGATHYLEHLLFKRTARRDALAIAAEIDAVGGELNGFTTKELTCYYARVVDEDVPVALDVLLDMVTSSLVTDDDVDAERHVVLEEIAMNADDPADSAHELFTQSMWGSSPVGRPVLGTAASIEALRPHQLRRWYRTRYTAPHLVVAAAGNLEHTALVRLVRASLAAAGLDAGDDSRPAPPRTAAGSTRRPRPRHGVHVIDRPAEQANVVVGVPGLPRDDRRWALALLSSVLGDGSSSRLFQSVREQRGLAYAVNSYFSSFADVGEFGVYVGCQPAKVGEVVGLVGAEMRAVAEHGITPLELARAKGQLRGGLVLGLEDTGARMTRLAKADLLSGELPSLSEVLRRIDTVTADEVHALAAELFAEPVSVAVVGPCDDDTVIRAAVA